MVEKYDKERKKAYELPCCAVPYLVMPYRTVPCRAIPYRAVPCHAVPCRTVPCRAVIITVPFPARKTTAHPVTMLGHGTGTGTGTVRYIRTVNFTQT